MARFDANSSGVILKFVPNVRQEQDADNGGPAPGTVYQLRFDEATNPTLIVAFNAQPSQFSMSGGTLTQTPPGGQSVAATINPPAPFYSAFLNSAAIMARLGSGQYQPTNEELAMIASAAFRSNGFAV